MIDTHIHRQLQPNALPAAFMANNNTHSRIIQPLNRHLANIIQFSISISALSDSLNL